MGRRVSVLLTTVVIISSASTSLSHAQSRSGRLVFTKQSPAATTEHLVNDRKFGGSSVKFAIEYGDEIIPHIKSESENFKQLDNRNAFWIAEVLGKIDTKLARDTLKELYGRDDSLPKLVGAIGLSMHGMDIGPINDDSFLVKTIRDESTLADRQTTGLAIEVSDYRELAIIAIGHSKSEAALPVLHEVLAVRPRSYWVHAHACEALARIKSSKSIPVLRECLQDPKFHALAEAYRAATCLGDKEATHLAIDRISPDIEGKNSGFVINELQRVTGKGWWFDRSKKNWQKWWAMEGEKWTIPEEFLADWDKQPHHY